MTFETLTSEALAVELELAIDASIVRLGGGTEALRPSHRQFFHWPPHPISYSFHVLASDWTGHESFIAHGETFSVRTAKTPHGVFGRCDAIWHEDRGDTLEEMLANLTASSEPLFQRQLQINETLGRPGRFTGHLRDLPALDLLMLLYCENRDVANEAKVEIETHASSDIFLPALLLILADKKHPNRRSAQWCVLDLFEDLVSFVTSEQDQKRAMDAIRALIWDAEDDYARTIYKAGVVLGGHMPDVFGAPILLDCLNAPSRMGRRSAIHGLFHVVEWAPNWREDVVSALRARTATEPDLFLKEYARGMANDIEQAEIEHVPDPIFPDEL